MKSCKCCGAIAPAEAPSCAFCGEASWEEARDVFAPDESPTAAPRKRKAASE
jgi:RNA polymerase subunit RPABC4/transcription elongation factor Spt4